MTAIYALTDPRDGEVRYIGKANDARKRLRGHLRDARRRRTPVYNWINKLARLGLEPGMTVLVECDPECWKDEERRLIAEHRASGRLLNVAEGGDEPHCPLEVRRRNGAATLHMLRTGEGRKDDDGKMELDEILSNYRWVHRAWTSLGQYGRAEETMRKIKEVERGQ